MHRETLGNKSYTYCHQITVFPVGVDHQALKYHVTETQLFIVIRLGFKQPKTFVAQQEYIVIP